MALIPCSATKSGRHSWAPGPYRLTYCFKCREKWTNVQKEPPPEEPTKVMVAEILDLLKEMNDKPKVMERICDCCFCRHQRTAK